MIHDIATLDRTDLIIADIQGKIKYTVLKPSKRGLKSLTGKRAWSNAAPKGSFMHNPTTAPGVTSNNKCHKVA